MTLTPSFLSRSSTPAHARGTIQAEQADLQADMYRTRPHPRQPPLLSSRRAAAWKRWWTYAGCTLILSLAALPAIAAERLTARFGPLQQSISVDDLEQFARSGEVPAGLQSYRMLLTPETQRLLASTLPLDPDVGNQLVEDLLLSSSGRRFLTILQKAIPNSTPEKIRVALHEAAQQPEGLSLLGVIRAYPEDQLVVDLASAIALGSQLNLPYWQSQALSSLLEQELTLPDPPAIHSQIDPTTSGPRWVRQISFTLRDYERFRAIPVDMYWSRRSNGQLVVLSHGFGADRRFLGYLAYHLASHGFTVAALEHPGSNVAWLTRLTSGRLHNGTLGELLPASEFIDRPKDISFLLDELDRMERRSNLLRGRLNTRQVTVIGHSLGGYTALALVGARLNLQRLREFCHSPMPTELSAADWLQCTAADLPNRLPDLRDDRIVQIMALNPVIGRLFDETSLAKIRVPTLVLSSTNDTITPAISQQLLPFTHLQMPKKYLVTAIGASHLSVGDPTNLNQALTESLLVRERRGEETEQVRRLLKGLALAFVQQVTLQGDRYKPFLTPAYVQSFSSPDLQLRMTTQLPDTLVAWLNQTVSPPEQPATLPLYSTLSQQSQFHCQGWACLVSGLPLVMFILPGSVPLATVHLLRRRHPLQLRAPWEKPCQPAPEEEHEDG